MSGLIVLIQEFQLGHEALNQELEKYALEEMNRKDSAKKDQHSNIGGWQSERDLHTKLGTSTPYDLALLKLFESFSSPMTQYINACCVKCNIKPSTSYDWNYTGAWFNVAARGGYNAPHTHPLSEISGAYYIRTEDPPPDYPFSGRIDFYYETGQNHFFPKPGTLILFPGTMLHFVHPYYGSGHRISLSFNLNNVHVLKS
jgi:uncharacterized protein (TIGR02466 family)